MWATLCIGLATMAAAAPLGYRTHIEHLADLAALVGQHASLVDVGTTVGGRPIRGLLIARDGGTHHRRVLLTGNIHGDEVVSRETLVALAARLAADPPPADVVLVPSVNPDGFEAGTRRNTNARDLNRCFPDRCEPRDHAVRSDWMYASFPPQFDCADGTMRTTCHTPLGRDPAPAFDYLDGRADATDDEWQAARLSRGSVVRAGGRGYDPDGRTPCTAENAPEVAALMALHDRFHFDASAALHGGALVVSLPWDNKCGDARYRAWSPHPSYAAHEAAAAAFVGALADRAGMMGNGTVNGAAWYQLNGGRQDWMLQNGARLSLTVELSNEKTPRAAALPAMLANVVPAVEALARHMATAALPQ